jgi:hypothetical protein
MIRQGRAARQRERRNHGKQQGCGQAGMAHRGAPDGGLSSASTQQRASRGHHRRVRRPTSGRAQPGLRIASRALVPAHFLSVGHAGRTALALRAPEILFPVAPVVGPRHCVLPLTAVSRRCEEFRT